MGSKKTLDEYRTGYVSTLYGVSDNCARALQLFEIGYSHSGAAQVLGLNRSTVKRYVDDLQDKIGDEVVATLTPLKPDFDVYGFRRLNQYGSLSYDDGVEHAQTRSWQYKYR